MKDGVIKRKKPDQLPVLIADMVALALSTMLNDIIRNTKREPAPPPDLFDSEVCGHQVTVTPDGQLFCYPVCTNGVTLDEIRLAAASHYLDRRGLTRDQYHYWCGIRQTTQLKNFESTRDRGRR